MVLCVGLTPTVQRTLFFAQPLAVGEVNRAKQVLVTASGKAVNVARVLTILGSPARLVQIVGGESGRQITQMLAGSDVAAESLVSSDNAPTRTCITILSGDGGATELVEEAQPLRPTDVTTVHEMVERLLPEASFLALSGSFPPGVPPDFYATLTQAAHQGGVRTVVDAQGAPLKLALAARPFLVKPNLEESLRTLGLTRTSDDWANARNAVSALTNAGAEWALVTMGKAGALLGDSATGNRWRIESPAVQAVNPIGAGDSLTAGFLHALGSEGTMVPDAVAYGTACAAANCLTPTSGVVLLEDVARLLPLVRLTRTV